MPCPDNMNPWKRLPSKIPNNTSNENKLGGEKEQVHQHIDPWDEAPDLPDEIESTSIEQPDYKNTFVNNKLGNALMRNIGNRQQHKS